MLLYTGALLGNYISENTSRRVFGSSKQGITVGGVKEDNERKRVMCSTISEIFMTINDSIEFALNFESCNNTKTCFIEFNVLPSLRGSLYDIILGEKSIIAHNLVSVYYNRFVKEIENKGREGSDQPVKHAHMQDNSGSPNLVHSVAMMDHRGREIDNPQYVAPDNTDDIDYVDEAQTWDSCEANIKQQVSSQIPSAIYGNETLRKSITKLCIEYVDIFSRTLSNIPADISPLELDIDLDLWQQPAQRWTTKITNSCEGGGNSTNKSRTCWQLKLSDPHNNSTIRKCILLQNQTTNGDFA
jgi:hypothetical protein